MCEIAEYINIEKINSIGNDIINVFSSNKEYLTKTECNIVLNIIFESLFEKKIKKEDFDNIFNTITKRNNNCVYKNELDPIITSLIVCFDVNYITNSASFILQDEIVCIKMKNSLPTKCYLKKNEKNENK
jgi:hypothetical protein